MPVSDDDLDLEKAEEACKKEHADDPDNPRFMFQLGRIYLINNFVKKVEDLLKTAVDNSHTASKFCLGKIFYEKNLGKEI